MNVYENIASGLRARRFAGAAIERGLQQARRHARAMLLEDHRDAWSHPVGRSPPFSPNHLAMNEVPA